MPNKLDNPYSDLGAVAVEEASPVGSNPYADLGAVSADNIGLSEPIIDRTPVKPTLPQYLRYKLTMDRASSDRSKYGAAAMWGRIDTLKALAEGNRIRDYWTEQAGPYQDLSFKEAPVKFVAGETVQLLPYMISSQVEGLKNGLPMAMGLGAMAAIAGQAGPQAAVPEELVTVPGATAAGLKVGWTYGVIKHTLDREGGGLYLDMVEKGISEKTARPMALAGGTVIGITEALQFKALSVPYKEAFSKILRTGPGKKAVMGAIIRYLKTVGTELTQEEIQEITSLTTETIAGMIDEKPNAKPTKEEWTTRLLETAKRAGAGLAVISAPGAAVDVTSSLKKAKQTDIQVVDKMIAEAKGEPAQKAETKIKGPQEPSTDIIEINGKQFLPETDIETGEIIYKQAPGIEEMETKPETKEEIAPEIPEQEARESIKDLQIKGRLEYLDTEFDSVQEQITEVELEKTARVEAGKPTKAIENKLNKLQRQSDFIDSERAELLTTAREDIRLSKEKVALTAEQLARREIENVEKRLKALERGQREGVVQTKKDIKYIQDKVISVIEESDLEANDKAKFMRTVKNIQTQEQWTKASPEIRARIESLRKKAQVRVAKAQLKKALKSTKTKKQSGKKVGKFTPEVQSALDTIRTIISMDEEQAKKQIARNLEAIQGFIPDEEVALQNEMLTMFSGFDEKSPEDLQKAIDTINKLKEGGKAANEVLKIERRAKVETLRGIVIEQVTGGKGIKEGRQTAGTRKTAGETLKAMFKGLGTRYVFSWNGILETLEFNAGVDNKKLVDLFGVLEQENKYKSLASEFINDLNRIITESYNIKTENLVDKVAAPLKIQKVLNELSKEIKLGTFKNNIGQTVELIFTKDELIKKYMELQDPSLMKSFLEGNNYTFEIMKAIYSKLTPQDRAFARQQMDLYKKQWKRINPLYRKFYGVNLPFNEFYSPIAREGYKEDLSKPFMQIAEDFAHRVAVSARSLKERVKNVLPIKTQGSVAVLDRHFKETNYFIAWSEKMHDLERVFKDTRVKTAINENFNPGVYKALANQLDDIASRGNKGARRYKAVDFFRKGFTVGALAAKPALTAKQFVSTLAYLEKVGPVSFTKGSLSFWLNPVKNYKTLANESIFIKERGGSNMERDIAAATETTIFKQYSAVQNYKNLATLNIKLGDKGAIVWGSWILRQDRLTKGIPLNEVIKEYEEFSSDTQQSSDISRLSEVQRGGSFDQLFTMFKSSQRQYLAKELNAIKSLFQKGGVSPKNIAKVARVMAIYHVLLPVMFQYVANFGGWSENDKKEYLRAGLLGSLNGLFIFGDVIDSLIRTVLRLKVWPSETPVSTIGESLEKAIKEIDFEDITAEDIGEAMIEFTEAGDSIGVPVTYIKNIGLGATNLMDGNIREGIGELGGWSPYSLGIKNKKGKSKGGF